MTVKALEDFDITRKDAERAKNMFALGMRSWLYDRPAEGTLSFLKAKFASKPEIMAANVAAFQAGWNYGETTEAFSVRYEVKPAPLVPGTYRNISGNTALAYGLVAASQLAGLPLFLGSYPITPASDILHELAKHKRFGVRTFQAEDEIAAIGAALGASFGGSLAVTSTSGPGMLLKAETAGLADLSQEFAFAQPAGLGENGFEPFRRDPVTLARPWAVPGTPGLEHRIGGIEKAHITGDISYDPDNHDRMVRLRQAKIDGIAADVPPLEVDDPDGAARVLVLGWGSTFGSIGAAVRRARNAGHSVAQAHLRHLIPFPPNLEDVLRRYVKVLLPEINLGQLALLLRGRFLVDVISYNQVRGLPFRAAELAGV